VGPEGDGIGIEVTGVAECGVTAPRVGRRIPVRVNDARLAPGEGAGRCREHRCQGCPRPVLAHDRPRIAREADPQIALDLGCVSPARRAFRALTSDQLESVEYEDVRTVVVWRPETWARALNDAEPREPPSDAGKAATGLGRIAQGQPRLEASKDG